MLIVIFLACAPLPPPQSHQEETLERPDVLLLTIDTLRADRVGAYGDSLAETPNIDALAATGALFRQAHSVTPLTLPSHASILTGVRPAIHGLRDNAGFSLPIALPTLAESLLELGYSTGAFVSAYVLHPAWGLHRGFERYHAPFHPQDLAGVTTFGAAEVPSGETINTAISWWKEQESPRFAWVHLYDPHAPWVAPTGWEGDPYRGEIAQVDHNLKRLLDQVGSESLVLVTSDHGEGLWEEGEREHGVLLQEGVTRVPLIIRPPGGLKGKIAPVPLPDRSQFQRPMGLDQGLDLSPVMDAPRAARVVESPVGGVDIGSTILDWAGGNTLGEGRSLRSLVEEGGSLIGPVFSETLFPYFHYGYHPLVMGFDGGQRVVRGKYLTAYNWPEKTPTDAESGLLSALDTWFGDIPNLPGPVDDETAAALVSLGYLSDPVVVSLEQAPDPRSKTEILRRLHEAEAMPPRLAVQGLEKLLSEEPSLHAGRLSLSLHLSALGFPLRALEQSMIILVDQPSHPSALNNAALLSREVGRLGQALELAERMIQLNEKDARGHRIATAVYVDKELPADVIIAGGAGLLVAPEDPNLHYLVGLAHLFTGEHGVAIHHLLAARTHGSRAKDVSLWLGVAHQRKGDIEGAVPHFEKASRDLPGDLRPWAMAGVMLADSGRCAAANRFLVNAARRGGASDPKIQASMRRCETP